MSRRWWAVALATLALATLSAQSLAGDGDHHGDDPSLEERVENYVEHAAAEADEAEGHGHGHHEPDWDSFNMWHGFLGENADAEPGLLWRKPGTPIPFGAMLLNTVLLFYLLIRVGGPKVSAALKARKESITVGMRQAADMRDEAEERLREYQDKLARIDEQIEEAKRQILDVAKAERTRALKEASEKRSRMERDARQLIELELKAAREALMAETVKAAMAAARQVIVEQTNASDEQRLQSEYLSAVRDSKLSVRGQA